MIVPPRRRSSVPGPLRRRQRQARVSACLSKLIPAPDRL
jgi:hypothetical protein